MKFKTILPISFLIISLTTGIGMGFHGYDNLYKTLTEEVYSHLKIVARANSRLIEAFLETTKTRVVNFSSDGAITKSLVDLKYGGNFERISEELEHHLVSNKISLDENIYEIYILDEAGNKIAESVAEEHEEEHEESGEQESFNKDILYLEGKKNPYIKRIFYDSEFTRIGMAFSAPILLNEEFLGVIIVKMTPGKLSEITTERETLGETGEVYIINENKELVTESRFLRGENKGVFTQVVDTENSEKCLSDVKKKIFDDDPHSFRNDPILFIDYRGENVLGAHDIIPEMNWCVLAEVDESEALDIPKNNYLKSVLVTLIAISTTSALLGFFVGRLLDAEFEKRGSLVKKGKK